MAEKTIIARITIGVHCPEESVPLTNPKTDAIIPGKFETVVLKHIPAGQPITISAADADALIERGVAELAPEQPVSAEPASPSGDAIASNKRGSAAA